jgi:pimeloyl-ACP methyl ester carboxylesterase
VHVPSTDGVRLALHDLGGEGPAVLVCHATGFHGRCYAPFGAELTASYHVWAVDFRGHGGSTAPDTGNFDWGGMGDDVLACVDALGGAPVFAVGHSMGGAAILLAELTRPGSVRAAYLYEPIVFPAGLRSPDEPNLLAESARRRREVFASRAEALYRYASRPPLGELRADALAAYVEHGFVDLPDGTVRLACRGALEAATFEASGKVTPEMTTAVQCPVVVACGVQAEGPNPAGFAPAVAEALPRGRLVTYPNLGHFGPLQDPVTTGRDALGHFLASTVT